MGTSVKQKKIATAMPPAKTITLSRAQTAIVTLLVSFVVVLALAIAPAVPAMTHWFNISKESSQLIISVYLFGFAFGHLIYAPLANRYGRRPVILCCLAFPTAKRSTSSQSTC